jgi:predicted NBD/HSP70 family sugar kinase
MERLAGSAKLLRAMNTSAVLAHLIGRGPLTRADIRDLTGLSKPTTSEVLRKLVAAELAMVTGYVSGGPGPNAEIYTANPDSAYAAALSVRETTGDPVVSLAVGDLARVTRARGEVTLDLSGEHPAAVLARALHDVCHGAGLDPGRIRFTQLGVPGSYDHTTDTIHHVDVPGLGRPGLVSALRAALGGAVSVDNDVNLAAVAERRRGVAAGAETFALLWLDDGLGLAIDLGGTLLRGARGGAGEIGYMPLGMPARGDVPGTRDLHGVLSGPEVAALAAAHGHETADLAAAVAAGGEEFLDALALRVAVAVATVVAVLDPALIVLSGAVGRAGGDRLRDAVSAALPTIGPLSAEVATTALTDDAVLLGALDAGLETVREDLIRSVHDANAPAIPTPR